MKYKFEDGIFDIEPTPWRESGFDFNLDINGMQVIQTIMILITLVLSL